MKYTYKKSKYLVIKNRDYIDKLKLLREQFIATIKLIPIDKIICIDESGFNTLYKTHMKGHSLKGKHLLLPIILGLFYFCTNILVQKCNKYE